MRKQTTQHKYRIRTTTIPSKMWNVRLEGDGMPYVNQFRNAAGHIEPQTCAEWHSGKWRDLTSIHK